MGHAHRPGPRELLLFHGGCDPLAVSTRRLRERHSSLDSSSLGHGHHGSSESILPGRKRLDHHSPRPIYSPPARRLVVAIRRVVAPWRHRTPTAIPRRPHVKLPPCPV